MLDWLQKKTDRVTSGFTPLIAVSTFVHISFLALFFFVYKTAPDFTLQVLGSRTKNTIVRVLPLGALKPTKRSVRTSKEAASSTTTTRASIKSGHKKAPTKKDKQSGKTQLAHNASTTKPTKKKRAKELEPKNKESGVALEQPASNAVVTGSPEQSTVVGTNSISSQEYGVSTVEVLSQGQSQENGAADENTLYVTQKEFELLQLQQQLQGALEAVWVCPAGVNKNLVCEVEVVADTTGAIIEREFITKTDVYIYDNAVEEALEELRLPQPLWGRSVRIAFKP